MLLHSLGAGEVVQLNDTNLLTSVYIMEDGSRIESPHRVSVSIFNHVGDDVTILLGRDSTLTIAKGVKIGKRFVAHIRGGNKAVIVFEDPNDIPSDANLRPSPQ